MKKTILLFLTFLTVLSGLNFAQEFSAQLRPRLILDNRDFNSSTGINSYTEMRSRLGVSFSPLSDLTAFVQIQDSRVFGTEPSTLSNIQNIDLHQAYFVLSDLFEMPVDLKVGRMEAAYGTERLMGAVGWSNVGRSFDGLTLKVELCCNVKFDLFAFREHESFNFADSSDQNVLGAYGYLDFFPDHSLQPFVIYSSSSNVVYPFDVFTFGANLIGDIEGFHHEAEFAFQTGSEINDGPTDVNAFMAAYNASYQFDVDAKPSIGAGIDYLSGDDDLADDDYKVFNTLFATNHKYYGFMDYFLNIPMHTYGLGLVDIHGKVGVSPTDKFSVKAVFHLFNSAEEYLGEGGTKLNSFGTEVDVVCDYKYNKNVGFQLGASFFSPDEIFELTKGSDSSTWFYLMAVVNL